jgi:DNA helicase HerA-like ATPase
MSLMSLIVENKIGSGRDKHIYETPLILTVDEAHNFLSNSDTVQDRYIVRKFNQVAKQGRKYKLGMFNISQTPEDINDGILKQSNSKIYLGLEPEVLKSIPVPEGFQNKIPNFGKGQAVVKAPDVKATEIEGFNVCVVKHSE